MVSVAPNCRAISSGFGSHVDGDDLLAARNHGALDDVQADAAGADHGDARARRHLTGVGHRADAGDDRAAERRQRLERHVGRHANRAGFRHDDERREARGARETARGPSARACSLVGPDGSLFLKVTFSTRSQSAARPSRQDGQTPHAGAQQSTTWSPGRRCVTDGADLADNARAFVAEDDRRLHRPVAARGMQIAVTDAGRLHLDEHLVGAWRIELGGFNGEGLALLPQDGGVNLHASKSHTVRLTRRHTTYNAEHAEIAENGKVFSASSASSASIVVRRIIQVT